MELRYSKYFLESVMPRRPYLTFELVERAVKFSVDVKTQDDGRIRYYGFIEEKGEFLRVVEDTNGEILNAMWNESYRPNKETL